MRFTIWANSTYEREKLTLYPGLNIAMQLSPDSEPKRFFPSAQLAETILIDLSPGTKKDGREPPR